MFVRKKIKTSFINVKKKTLKQTKTCDTCRRFVDIYILRWCVDAL